MWAVISVLLKNWKLVAAATVVALALAAVGYHRVTVSGLESALAQARAELAEQSARMVKLEGAVAERDSALTAACEGQEVARRALDGLRRQIDAERVAAATLRERLARKDRVMAVARCVPATQVKSEVADDATSDAAVQLLSDIFK